MARQYSRLASVEERRNFRSAALFILLTIGAVVLLYFVGIPALWKFAAFVSDLGKSNKAISTNDKTPPAPPHFDQFPDFTNQNILALTGTSEPGATVKITFNGNEKENVSDKSGKFTFSLQLKDGENDFTGVATDQAGNVSQKTQTFKIIYDNKVPDLTIASPADGAQFFGSSQRQITIQGSTEPNSQVTVNDRIVAVGDDGKFQFTTSLTDGENKFSIKSVDPAGNPTQKDLTLSFTP